MNDRNKIDIAATELGVSRELLAEMYAAGGDLESIVLGCKRLLRNSRAIDPEREIRVALREVREPPTALEAASRAMLLFGPTHARVMLLIARGVDPRVAA